MLKSLGYLSSAEKCHCFDLACLEFDQEVGFTYPAQQVAPSLDAIERLVGMTGRADSLEGLLRAPEPQRHDLSFAGSRTLLPKPLQLVIAALVPLKVGKPGQSGLLVDEILVIVPCMRTLATSLSQLLSQVVKLEQASFGSRLLQLGLMLVELLSFALLGELVRRQALKGELELR